MTHEFDLRGYLLEAFGKDSFTDSPDDLVHFGKDWTTRVLPNARLIFFPTSTDQVSAVLKVCNREKISVVPSGGRTGLAGGAVAANFEMVLSLDRMNRLIEFRAAEARVRVQAGMIHQSLQDVVASADLMWPVDLASKGSSQIGGNISTNAGGLRVLRYGHCRNWVQSVQVVLADGRVMEFSGELEKNNTGYDLRQLFIGGEGTLGIITEATLKLVPKPRESVVLLCSGAGVARFQQLLALARDLGLQMLAAEFFAANCLATVIEIQQLKAPFAEAADFYGLLEFEVSTGEDREKVSTFVEKALASQLLKDGTLGENESSRRELWRYRETITESISRLGAVYKNDLSLPLNRLAGFLDFVSNLTDVQSAGAEAFLFGHFGDGNVHVNLVNRTPKSATDREKFFLACEKLNHVLFAELKRVGGSIAAEHGVGLLKKQYLQYTRPAAEIELMRQIKGVFDPNHILNPGKIFDL